MTDKIRKAVELADGWDVHTSFGNLILDRRGSDFVIQVLTDALAAQLVRQVDAHSDYYMAFVNYREGGLTYAEVAQENGVFRVGFADGPDRTMNTIKAIVDSGVLEND